MFCFWLFEGLVGFLRKENVSVEKYLSIIAHRAENYFVVIIFPLWVLQNLDCDNFILDRWKLVDLPQLIRCLKQVLSLALDSHRRVLDCDNLIFPISVKICELTKP